MYLAAHAHDDEYCEALTGAAGATSDVRCVVLMFALHTGNPERVYVVRAHLQRGAMQADMRTAYLKRTAPSLCAMT